MDLNRMRDLANIDNNKTKQKKQINTYSIKSFNQKYDSKKRRLFEKPKHKKISKGLLNELAQDNILEEYIQQHPELNKYAEKSNAQKSSQTDNNNINEQNFLKRVQQISQETIKADKKINSNKYPNYYAAQNSFNYQEPVNENQNIQNPLSDLLNTKSPMDDEITKSIEDFKKMTMVNEDEPEEEPKNDNTDVETGELDNTPKDKENTNTSDKNDNEEIPDEETEKEIKTKEKPSKNTDKNIGQIIKAVSKLAKYINWNSDLTESNIKKLASNILNNLNKDEPNKNNLAGLALLLASADLIDDQQLQQVIVSNFKKYILGNKSIEQFAQNVKDLNIDKDYEGKTVIPDEEKGEEEENKNPENNDQEEIDFDNIDYGNEEENKSEDEITGEL